MGQGYGVGGVVGRYEGKWAAVRVCDVIVSEVDGDNNVGRVCRGVSGEGVSHVIE